MAALHVGMKAVQRSVLTHIGIYLYHVRALNQRGLVSCHGVARNIARGGTAMGNDQDALFCGIKNVHKRSPFYLIFIGIGRIQRYHEAKMLACKDIFAKPSVTQRQPKACVSKACCVYYTVNSLLFQPHSIVLAAFSAALFFDLYNKAGLSATVSPALFSYLVDLN
jgi:hypothetical protein